MRSNPQMKQDLFRLPSQDARIFESPLQLEEGNQHSDGDDDEQDASNLDDSHGRAPCPPRGVTDSVTRHSFGGTGSRRSSPERPQSARPPDPLRSTSTPNH